MILQVARNDIIRSVILGSIFVGIATSAAGAEFDCIIEPRQMLELRSPIEGLIERVHVDRGDYVRKGQELAVLDTSVERVQAAISSQRAQMEGAVRSWESRSELSAKKASRTDELHRQNFISAQARDEALAEKRVAQLLAERRHARVRSELMRIDDQVSDMLAFTGRAE